MAEEPDQHWPTERMILEGEADVATPEDLDGLPDGRLWEIANLCFVEDMAPDECIPCRALAIVLERRAQEVTVTPPDSVFIGPDAATTVDAVISEIPTLEEDALFPEDVEQVPVVERFAGKVADLQSLVNEMLQGPPIPPKNVTLEELAALTVGAMKWINFINSQGIELSPAQEAVKREIARVVAKVQNDA